MTSLYGSDNSAVVAVEHGGQAAAESKHVAGRGDVFMERAVHRSTDRQRR